MIKYLLFTILLLAISTLGFSQSYLPSSANSSTSYSIKNVTFSGIDKTTSNSSYSDYTSQVASVNAGSSYVLSVTIKGGNKQHLTTWIDWNNDGDFVDFGEDYEMTTSGNKERTYTKNITVPAGAAIATTRMRVTMIYNKVPTSTGSQVASGEVEDYSVNVAAAIIITPPANRADLMYYVSNSDHNLYMVDVTDGSCSLIGATGVNEIEAIANWPAHLENKLYAADNGDFGKLNTSTGAFTKINEIDGGGTANGSVGGQSLNDVDGLAFDARTGVLWASNRRGTDGEYDLMFQIDVTTGKYVADAFGAGVDYVVIDGVGVNDDIDDISISPVTGEMFVVNNQGHNTTDQILKINKSTGAVQVTTSFVSLIDVEGCDFAYDGTLYVSEGSNNTFNSVDQDTGISVQIKNPLCGGGDVESLASLVQETNSMEGKVWKDTDEDGIKDAGETAGLANVQIKIYFDANGDSVINGSDEYLNTVVTDADGNWSFEYATTGNLIAEIDESTLPSGYALTSNNIQTATFTTSGNTNSNNNFGAINNFADCDSDGIPNFVEGALDSDFDGVQDMCDRDSDNDGILDADESTKDTDGDGVADYLDLDSDNDGIPDAIEANGGIPPSNYSSVGRIVSSIDVWGLSTTVYSGGVSNSLNLDSDKDGVKDYKDLDSDNDGILDIVEASAYDSADPDAADTDGNGTVDGFADSNNDGYNDSYVSNPLLIPNSDSDAFANYIDIDSDDDSIDDSREGYSPADYTVVSIVKDSDGDGILDLYDISSGGESIVPFDFDYIADANTDGVPDYIDQDSDDDGALDIVEGNDADGNGVPDSYPSGNDANMNGLDDTFDNVCTGTSIIEITASSKNEEDVSDGNDHLSSSDIELVYDAEQQVVGIRFSGVNIAPGTSISSANIQFVTDSPDNSGEVIFTIKGDSAANAAEVGGYHDISGRTKTTASVSWSPKTWDTAGEAGEAQKTTNIASIIQNIVNMPAWVSGNAIMIIIEGTSTTDYRRADWDNGRPVLNISTYDGLQYNCGSDIAINDFDNNNQKDFRDVGIVLPVSLISFTAEKVNDYVELNWTTASEINNDYFSVERSDDNKNYQEIDLVSGAGNSNVILDYSSIDFNVLQGVSYYRLKQVDYDGTTAYSNVVSVRNVDGENIILYPNPNNGQFVIEVKETVEVSIYNVTGQIVYNNTFEDNSNNRIDLSNQKQGVYIVTYYYSDEVKTSKLIIK